jgi:hypothetical protein
MQWHIMQMQIDLKRRYRLGTVAKAVGVPNATLASWLQRGQIELLKEWKDKQSAGTGDHRLFSWHRILNIAVVAELNRLGIPPSAGSSQAALAFSDFGDTVAYWGEEAPPSERLPGELYRTGETYLIVRSIDGKLEADVARKLDNVWSAPGASVIRPGSPDSLDHYTASAVVIDMKLLVHRVHRHLAAVDE